ncbi:MAG TPA: tetratricopeptide repeat protein, partial [Longimicrobiaceae bacterium]|nr:tetratricopeptide repeat protein [Longimicrobiaceae bacterium]
MRHHLAGEHEAAELEYRETLALAPETAEAHNNLGVLIRDREPEQALEHFTEAVRLVPVYAEGLINRGLILQRLGRAEAAREAFEAAVREHPQNAKALNNYGLILRELGDLQGAQHALERAVALSPQDPGIRTNLGNVYLELARIGDAIDCYEAALTTDPESVEALNNLGGAYRSQRNFPEAIRLFRKALELRPDFLDALHNLALAVPPDMETARENEAILRYAAERNPDIPAYGAVLATGLQEGGRIEEARAEALHVLEQEPKNTAARNVLAVAAIHALDYAGALQQCERVLERAPRDTTARWNRALALLALGDYERGWAAYESRWQLVHFALEHRNFPEPAWDGSSLDGRTILLYTEQGLGDGIQFIRFAKRLKERWDARIIVEAAPALAPLFRTCPWLDDVFPRGQAAPSFDVHAAILSLPWLLGVELEEVSGEAYLEARPRPVTKRIEPSRRLRVGLVWGGGAPTPTLAWRSLQLEQLRPLLEIEGIDFYSLQKGDAASQLQAFPLSDRIVDLGPDLHDFTDTAAAIEDLDLVVSIDTSVAHLAGALGKPVWILLIRSADWRWLADRDDSPWYGSARLFRQRTNGEWAAVVEQVRGALKTLAEAHAGPNSDSDHGRAILGGGDVEEVCTEIRSQQTLADGTPRFSIPVPIRFLSDPRRLQHLQAELSGEGVDPELRRFLDDELRSGDVFVDLAANWGFAALSAATLPERSVTVVALAEDETEERIIARAGRENRLTGGLRVHAKKHGAEESVDEILPVSRVAGHGQLFLRIPRGVDPVAALAG